MSEKHKCEHCGYIFSDKALSKMSDEEIDEFAKELIEHMSEEHPDIANEIMSDYKKKFINVMEQED